MTFSRLKSLKESRRTKLRKCRERRPGKVMVFFVPEKVTENPKCNLPE